MLPPGPRSLDQSAGAKHVCPASIFCAFEHTSCELRTITKGRGEGNVSILLVSCRASMVRAMVGPPRKTVKPTGGLDHGARRHLRSQATAVRRSCRRRVLV